MRNHFKNNVSIIFIIRTLLYCENQENQEDKLFLHNWSYKNDSEVKKKIDLILILDVEYNAFILIHLLLFEEVINLPFLCI